MSRWALRANMTHMVDSSTRRTFLGGTLLVLGGCATRSTSRLTRVPGPIWESPATTEPPPATTLPDAAGAGIMPRRNWAKGNPIPTRMDRMTPIHRITIHHDGMSAFTETSLAAASGRLESIRRSHLRRRPQPFGDIGYHYAIDPAGRVWGGRPVTWQGAHVRAQNQGNLGIVVLGNYELQGVNEAQKRAIVRFLGQQMRTYGVPRSKVATHQEMAPTACPGASLQRFMMTARHGPLA
ncbi:MAG: peptidoglycan recognition family protein [Phycisphaerales bacterium]|nr:peptidoglycan recognition family protein [Phycisphaerales bacterium]